MAKQSAENARAQEARAHAAGRDPAGRRHPARATPASPEPSPPPARGSRRRRLADEGSGAALIAGLRRDAARGEADSDAMALRRLSAGRRSLLNPDGRSPPGCAPAPPSATRCAACSTDPPTPSLRAERTSLPPRPDQERPWPSTSASATSRRACSTSGDGARTHFPFPFPIFAEADLEIRIGGVLARGGFAVAGRRRESGGTSPRTRRPPAPPSRSAAAARERVTDFQDNGVLRAHTLNDELDRITAALQEQREEIGSAIRQDPAEVGGRLTLPAAQRPRQPLLGFDCGGDVGGLPARIRRADRALPRAVRGRWRTSSPSACPRASTSATRATARR
jgi:hypothetical protein